MNRDKNTANIIGNNPAAVTPTATNPTAEGRRLLSKGSNQRNFYVDCHKIKHFNHLSIEEYTRVRKQRVKRKIKQEMEEYLEC